MYNKHNRTIYKLFSNRCSLDNVVFCARKNASTTNTKEKKTPVGSAPAENSKSFKTRLTKYFNSKPHLKKIQEYIPKKYLINKRYPAIIENLYLIDSEIAKDIVKHILPILQSNKNQLVCETNAGLGFITTELLDNGIELVRLYETCSEFRVTLKDFNDMYPGRIELFTKSLYSAPTLAYMDKIDNGNRIEQILKGVPQRKWTDDPVMSIIGPMPNPNFIRYLIKALTLQIDFVKRGRMHLFPIMQPKDFTILTANCDKNLHTYQSWSILFNLFFDYKLLAKYPRQAFLPWESKKISARTRYATKIDMDQMYLVDIVFKKDLLEKLPADELLAFFYFVRQFFGKGSNKVIPTVEKWIPGCGLNIFLPQLEHDSNFSSDMDIFTQFGSLTPQQILCIFKEVVNHPGYQESPFWAMVESHLIRSETIETDLVSNEPDLDKDATEVLEEKFNM